MLDTSGPSSLTPLAFYDPDSCFWKTSQATFLSDSMSSSLTLPASGMTRRGVLYALPMSALATGGPVSSFLPTPTTEPMTGNGHARNLGKEAALLRTPQASVTEPKPGIKLDGRTPADPQVGLIDQIHALLPTPVAHDDGKSPEAHMAMKQRMVGGPRNGITSLSVMARQAGATGKWDAALLPTPVAGDHARGLYDRPARPGAQGDNLTGHLAKLLPTPNATDYKGASGRDGRRPVSHDDLPARVGRFLPTPTTSDAKGPSPNHGGTTAEAIGALTAPPSPVTKPPSVDPPPTLWTEPDDSLRPSPNG